MIRSDLEFIVRALTKAPRNTLGMVAKSLWYFLSKEEANLETLKILKCLREIILRIQARVDDVYIDTYIRYMLEITKSAGKESTLDFEWNL